MDSQLADVDVILKSLHSELNDTSRSISLHTKTFAELQKICAEQEEKIKSLEAARIVADKRAALAEEKLLVSDGKVTYLEKNVKAWQEAYNTVVQENQELKSALQQAQYATASKDAALYYEREARQKLNDVLERASKTKMDDNQIIALLQQEIANNPSDANYLKLLTEHIEKIKNLKQVNEDTYLAYRLQHGDEKANDIKKQQEDERKRKEQNRKDEEYARKLQNEEIKAAKAKPQVKQQGSRNKDPPSIPNRSNQPNYNTTTLVLPPAGSSNSIYYVPPPNTATVYASNPVQNQYPANNNPPPYNTGPYTNAPYPPPSYNNQNPPPYQYPSVPQVFPNAYHSNSPIGVGNRNL